MTPPRRFAEQGRRSAEKGWDDWNDARARDVRALFTLKWQLQSP
jgi:hypothetical protein